MSEENASIGRIDAAGMEAYFHHIYAEYYGDLCNYALRFVNDKDDAEEIVQDIIFKLWQQREQLEGIKSIKAYLFRSVHNRCLNFIKHELHKEKYIDKAWKELKKIELENYDDIQNKELEEKLQRAIQELPDRCREVFLLSRFEGKKNKEISDSLGISVKAVEANITRALLSLREKIKPYMNINLPVAFALMMFVRM